MSKALAIYQDFDGLQRAATALEASKYFPDVKSEAQAIVKVMAGAELGLPPFASMSGIHIISGKPVLGSNVIATLVKNDPRYDYRVKQADDKACVLEWLEDGRKVGEAGFTIQEAQAAGLTTKDNWKKYTSDMLFARAISRGARRFAPGIFGGAPVYTPDEMGVDTDEDGYIDAESAVTVDPVEVERVEEQAGEDGSPIPVIGEDVDSDKWMPPETVGELMEQAYQGTVPHVPYDMMKVFREEADGDLRAMLDKIEHEQERAS